MKATSPDVRPRKPHEGLLIRWTCAFWSVGGAVQIFDCRRDARVSLSGWGWNEFGNCAYKRGLFGARNPSPGACSMWPALKENCMSKGIDQ